MWCVQIGHEQEWSGPEMVMIRNIYDERSRVVRRILCHLLLLVMCFIRLGEGMGTAKGSK